MSSRWPSVIPWPVVIVNVPAVLVVRVVNVPVLAADKSAVVVPTSFPVTTNVRVWGAAAPVPLLYVVVSVIVRLGLDTGYT